MVLGLIHAGHKLNCDNLYFAQGRQGPRGADGRFAGRCGLPIEAPRISVQAHLLIGFAGIGFVVCHKRRHLNAVTSAPK